MTAASEAAFRVMHAEIQLEIAGGVSRFPDRTAFVPSDRATPEHISGHHARGYAVVIVDADESVRVVPAP
jgi:hypothetical protein